MPQQIVILWPTFCQGTVAYASGNKYVGEFKDGKRHGKGAYTFTNGNKYVGEFKDDYFSGQGTFTLANGANCIGSQMKID